MPSQRVRPQIGLLTMLLVLSCVAAGLAIGLSRRKIEETNALLAVLRPFKQELVGVDPSKITAVRRKPRDLFDKVNACPSCRGPKLAQMVIPFNNAPT